VVSGLGQGARFTRLDWARRQFIERLGVDPHPGTLNLQIETPASRSTWREIRSGWAEIVAEGGGVECEARCFPARIAGRIPGAIVLPEVASYDPSQLELIAAVSLRDELGLADGDSLEVSSADLSAVAGVVFDVDGTLVNSIEGIQVAASRSAAMYGVDVPLDLVRRAMDGGGSLWDLVLPEELRQDQEIVSILRMETMRHWSTVLAQSVQPLPGLADTLESLRMAGLRLAIFTGSRGESFLPLQRAGLMDYFDPVVTALHVRQPKPAPDGLLQCVERMGCPAGQLVYVGDSRHDMQAARAAGMRAVGVLTGAADGAMLSLAGAERLVPDHRRLPDILRPAMAPARSGRTT
jgi:HAD superfamily hydrolase (TIGR01509 family)